MRLTAHPPVVLKVLALAAAMLAGAPSQAALTTLTLDSGLQVSQDAATGLLWRSFDDAAAGVQAGFRQATVADFNDLLSNQGYQSTGRVPYGLTERVVIPAVSQTVDMGWGFATKDGSTLSEGAVDAANALHKQYQSDLEELAQGGFPPELEMTADVITRNYRVSAERYAIRFGLVVISRTNTVTITPEQIFDRPVSAYADGIQATYYSTNDSSGFRVAGIHEYDNSYPFAAEYHHAFIGQVAAGNAYWVGATTSNHIPQQCLPGDPGYSQYGASVQYCGGRSYASAYLGPEASTEFKNSYFSRTDYSPGVKPYGYLMVQSVPEPSTYVLMGLGLLGMACAGARRHRST